MSSALLRYEILNVTSKSFTIKIHEAEQPVSIIVEEGLEKNPYKLTGVIKSFIIGILFDYFVFNKQEYMKTETYKRTDLEIILELLSKDDDPEFVGQIDEPGIWIESGYKTCDALYGEDDYNITKSKLKKYGIEISKSTRLCDIIIDEIEIVNIDKSIEYESCVEIVINLPENNWTSNIGEINNDTTLWIDTPYYYQDYRSLVFNDEKSNKFWIAELTDSEWTAKWGKIGTEGQEKSHKCESEEYAKKEFDSAVKSKLKKGYVDTEFRSTLIYKKK